MTDPRLAPAGERSHTAASLEDSETAMLESIAMLAILSSAIREVRLFESTEGHRTPLFETPLPRLQEMLLLLESVFVPQPAQDPKLLSARLGQHANELLLGWHRANNPSALLVLREWLQHYVDADTTWDTTTAKAVLGAIRSFDPALESLPTQARMAFAVQEPFPARQATLDLIFDTLHGSWLAELNAVTELPGGGQDLAEVAAAPEPRGQDRMVLRGEDLDELRRNAARFPPPEPAAPLDLPSDAYLTAAEAAERLHVAKSTVTRRIAQNRLIGFREFTRALRIPKDQFDGEDVVRGVPDVLALFARSPDQPVDHRAAWAFLNSDLFHGDADPRPIDRLRTAAATGAISALLSELASTKESLDRGDHF